MNGVCFDIPQGGRLVCVSDCHGDYVLLRRLLDLAALRPQDVLAVIGDFSNKGPGNLACVSYLMDLSRTRAHTIILAGNGEYANTRAFLSGDRDKILRYCEKWPKNNLYRDWAGQCGFERIGPDNFQAVHDAVTGAFGDQLRWLRDLPLYAVNERYLLVHAGMERLPQDGQAGVECLSSDCFLKNGENHTGRWQIVGHWPVANLEPGLMEPLIDTERRIIGIDGGVNTHGYAQLNALICTPDGFETLHVDADLSAVAGADYDPPQMDPPLICDWTDRWVTVLCRGASFCKCRTRSGREGMVKNELLHKDADGELVLYAGRSALLPLKRGETVKVLDRRFDGWWYIKNGRGQLGFAPAALFAAPDTAAFPGFES